ncbi:MAG: hypothetical protein ACRDU0_09580, partial [Mycobacterium sp.]
PAPILLWWGAEALLVAAIASLGGNLFYRNAKRLRCANARHLALFSSLVVGIFLGCQHARWAALIPGPLFAGLLNLHSRHVGPEQERRRAERAAPWNASVVGGELLGYLSAIVARALIG